MNSVIVVLKVMDREWVQIDGVIQPDGAVLSPQYPALLQGATETLVAATLETANVNVDPTSVVNDRVDVILTVGDRVSKLMPGTFILVLDDGRLSTVTGASQIDIDADGRAVITFE